MYLLILVQAAEISNQPMLLGLLSNPLCYGLSLALLRPVQDHKPRLPFTRHAGKYRETVSSVPSFNWLLSSFAFVIH